MNDSCDGVLVQLRVVFTFCTATMRAMASRSALNPMCSSKWCKSGTFKKLNGQQIPKLENVAS
jgi:hypothetical protein